MEILTILAVMVAATVFALSMIFGMPWLAGVGLVLIGLAGFWCIQTAGAFVLGPHQEH